MRWNVLQLNATNLYMYIDCSLKVAITQCNFKNDLKLISSQDTCIENSLTASHRWFSLCCALPELLSDFACSLLDRHHFLKRRFPAQTNI